MSLVCQHLLIEGKVQGVCFRHYTRQTALKNRVTGWVRNLPDGRVEVLIEGEPQAVKETVNWCRSGPEWARVDKVLIKEKVATREFESFSVR